MRIAGTIQDSIVDGPGLRYVVFTQGCEKRCPGCHNSGTWDFDGGREVPVEELIKAMRSNPLSDGLTLSGGEPFLQAKDCYKLACAAHESGLNVWCYSGYTYGELSEQAMTKPEWAMLLGAIDVLVDGMFAEEQRSLNLKWRGSTNQSVLDMAKTREAGVPVWLDK